MVGSPFGKHGKRGTGLSGGSWWLRLLSGATIAALVGGMAALPAQAEGPAEPTPSVSPTAPTPEPEEVAPEPSTEPSEAPSEEAPAEEPEPAQEAPAPRTAPQTRASTDAIITVKAGGFAEAASGAVSSLSGVTFRAISVGWPYFQPARSAFSDTGLPSCTTAASGSCSISVPANKRYWVAPVATSGTGWTPLAELSTAVTTRYSYLTKDLGDNAQTTLPQEATRPNTDQGYDFGSKFASVYDNPAFPNQCGMNLAMVLDTSGSISNDQMTELKTAANLFVGAEGLGKTATNLQLFRFATGASVMSGQISLLNQSGITEAQNLIGSLGEKGSGKTNWDQALRLVNATGRYDMVVFITDGEPTTDQDGSTGSNTTHQRFIENGVFSANAVKQTGAKLLPVAVGLSGNALNNIRAISGPVAGTDYVTADNFGTLQAQLKELATKSCGGTVTVQKQIVDEAGTPLADQSGAAGWAFTASGDGVTGPKTQTTGDSHAVNFPVDFTGVTGARSITITEQQQPGFTLADAGTCSVGGKPVTVTKTATGVTVPVSSNQIVSCVVKNTPVPTGAVTVQKHWVVNGKETKDGTVPSGFGAPTLAIDGLTGTTPAWGETVSGITTGTKLTVREQAGTMPPLCVAAQPTVQLNGGTPQGLTRDGFPVTVTKEPSVVTVTNRITCDGAPELTVEKRVLSNEQILTGKDAGSWRTVFEIVVRNPSAFPSRFDLHDTLRYGEGAVLGSATIGGDRGTLLSNWTGQGSATLLAADVTLPAGDTGTFNVTTLTQVPGSFFAGEPAPAQCAPGTEPGGFRNVANLVFTKSARSAAAPSEAPNGAHEATACAEPAAPSFEKSAEAVTQDDEGNSVVSYLLTVTGAPGATTGYTLRDTPEALPAGTTLVKQWTVAALDGAPAANQDWTGTGVTDAVVTNAKLPAGASHVFRVTGTISVDTADAESLSCEAGGVRNRAALLSGGVLIEDDACAGLETPPTATVQKSVTSAAQAADGTWTVTYAVTATNASATQAARFSLSDELRFGGGITVTGQSATGTGVRADWTGAGEHTQLASGLLAAGEARAFTVTVTAEVAKGVVGSPAAQCAEAGSDETGGFLNTVALTAGGSTSEAEACAEPSAPSVAKTAAAAVQQADGSWSVSYTVTVTGGEYDGAYVVTDTPRALPAGVSLVGAWSASAAEGSPAVAEGWDGVEKTELARGTIAAGASHVFTVSATLRLAVNTAPEGLLCSAEGGVWNDAALTSGKTVVAPESACVEIEQPGATVTKTLNPEAPTRQNADGSWTVSYLVTATNASALSVPYALHDSLRFGEGITVGDRSVSGEGARSDWTGEGEKTHLATGVLPAGESHAFVVTVTATVAAGVVGSSAGECSAEGAEGNRGFLNTVVLTAGGSTSEAEACDAPETPTFAKAAVGDGVRNADGSWTVTYALTVTGAATKATSYTLTDTPEALPAGATVVAPWRLSRAADDAVSPEPRDAWNGASDVRVVDATEIAPGQQHTFHASVTLRLPVTATAGDLRCEADGPGGVINHASLSSGAVTIDREACSSLEPGPGATVAKRVAEVGQNPDGSWTVAYEVTATNASEELPSEYALSDTLRFGTGMVLGERAVTGPAGFAANADWDGVEVTDLGSGTLAGGESHTVRVVVTATLPAGLVGSPAGRCPAPETEGAGGFLNTAELTAGGATDTAEACAEPSVPSLTKVAWKQLAKPNADGVSLIEYLITVTGGASDSVYELSDRPELPKTVTPAGAWTVVDPAGVSAEWDGTAVLASGVALAAGATHEYRLSLPVTVTTEATSAQLRCEEEGGARNTAELVSGAERLQASACVTLLPPEPKTDKPNPPTPGVTPKAALPGGIATAGGESFLGLGAGALALLLAGGLLLGARRIRKQG